MTARNELRAEIEIDADPDTVWGVLPFVRRSVLPATLRGFEAMNRALADRAVAQKTSAGKGSAA